VGCDPALSGSRRFVALARRSVKEAGFDESDNASIVDPVPLTSLLLIMLAISLTLLRWTRKQGWW